MKIFRKRILPKIWLSAIAIGILFLGFAGATVQASNNQNSMQSNGFIDLTPVSDYLLGTSESNLSLLVDTVQFSSPTFTVAETGTPPGFVQITVTRTGDLSTVGTVDYSLDSGGTGEGFAVGGAACTAGVDYINTSGTLTFNPGVQSQTFVVPICNDAIAEGNETFNVFLTNPNGVLVGSPSSATVTILANDPSGPGTFQFTSTTFSGTEDGGTALLTITRTGGATGAATISYTLNGAPGGGTATGGASCNTAGVDFVNTPGTVTFASGQTSATITVQLCNDAIAEGNETFTATLTGTTAGTLGSPTTATVVIIDADPSQPGQVQFSATSLTPSVAEYTGTITLSVTRTGGTSGAVSVNYQISNGTAVGGNSCTPGVDYVFPNGSQTGTLNFRSGQQSVTQTITIQICKDLVDELHETFTVTLQNANGGVTINPAGSTATVTILDDENGVFQFTQTAIPGTGNTLSENAGTVLITVSRVDVDPTVGTIGRVSVDYATSNTTSTTTNAQGGAACGTTVNGVNADYVTQSGTLTFDPGVTSQTFTIQICNDSAFEINAEIFRITLSNPQTISGGLGNPIIGPRSVTTVTITDDDPAQPGVFTISASPNPVIEGQSVTITITRSGGTDTAVTVENITINGTAIGGTTCTGSTGNVDYITDNFTNPFPNSQTSGGTQTLSFTIPTCNDTVFEAAETFTVQLQNPTGGATLGNPSSVTITILDNDAQAGTIQFNPTTYTVNESAGSVQVIVRRTSGFDVAVSATVGFFGGNATGGPSCTAGVDYIDSNQQVNFPAIASPGPPNGFQDVAVNVQICPDSTLEPDETFTALLFNPTGGVTLGANTQANVTIRDDENGTLQFSQADYPVNEGAGFVTVTVTRLANQSGSTGTVSVNYTLSDGTATGGPSCGGTVDYVNPAGSPDGTLTFGNGVTTQTFNIPICDDLLDELPETINITLSNPTGGNVVIGAQNTATVTITDNDATPTLSISNVTQNEGNTVGATTPFTFNVTLSGASGQQATVNFATANGTATGGAACGAGVDYITTSGTLTFAPGATTQAVTVLVCGDLEFEQPETFFVNLSNAVNATLPANPQGVGTIQNDDGAPGTISVVNTGGNSNIVRVIEGTTGATNTVSFTLTNNNPNALPASIQFTTTNQGSINGTPTSGTATGGAACTAGVDYITTSGTANFAANSTTSTPITITICGDTLKEPNEIIFLTFSNPNNTNIPAGTQGIVIIVDDDRAIRADFDRDRRTDFSVYRPSNGFFYILQSINGLFMADQLGQAGDIPAPGDYDNDGAADLALFRPSTGTFIIRRSTDNVIMNVRLGASGDLPAQGDYDGDGDTDVAVFRPSIGTFFTSTDPATNFGAIQFGQNGDIPVQADYDGDGRTDVAVYRGGVFFVRRSRDNSVFGIQYGLATDIPVTGDFDGDGKSDFTVFRPSTGTFFTFQSLTNMSSGVQFGQNGDIPSIGDYDGDGRDDYAVFRPSTGTFFVLQSSNNVAIGRQFGQNGDIPVPSRYQPTP